MNRELQQLLAKSPHVWRGRSVHEGAGLYYPSGHSALDEQLPGGGWPKNALTEIIVARWGVGELQMLMPLLRRLSGDKRWLLWVCPPYRPYAPALLNAGIDTAFVTVVKKNITEKDKLWTIEKALQSGSCGLVLGWAQGFSHVVSRRLQLAAESGATPGILFSQRETKNSYAALRLVISPAPGGVSVSILKARGTFSRRTFYIRLKRA